MNQPHRHRQRAKKASDDYLASKLGAGSAGSVSGASGSGSADDGEYYNTYNPVRTAPGMLAPHGRAIAPQSIKAVSPTPSQTQVGFFFMSCRGGVSCAGGRVFFLFFLFCILL